MEIENAKGTRDILPEQKILRNQIIKVITKVFEKYGYDPLETPSLERFETLSSKFAGGEEIMKEIFSLTDQGNRKLGLRYDLTVPLARVIAQNPNIKMPFKRYQIANVWRDGPIKLGRYREFTQCDADVVGSNSRLVDAELLAIANEVFEKLDLKVIIKLNSIKILNEICKQAQIKDPQDAILTLDKLDKIGEQGVKKELKEKKYSEKQITELINLFSISGKNQDILKKIPAEAREELQEVLSYAEIFKLKNVQIVPSLARGLSYYTGTIFEVYIDASEKSEIKGSIAAGGRFDNMIGKFAGREVPAIGISFGLDVIFDALSKKLGEEKIKKSNVKVYVVPIGIEIKQTLKIVNDLRQGNINTDFDFSGRGISKNLDYASKKGIPYVLIVGTDELKSKKLTLRNMLTGKEEKLELNNVISTLTK